MWRISLTPRSRDHAIHCYIIWLMKHEASDSRNSQRFPCKTFISHLAVIDTSGQDLGRNGKKISVRHALKKLTERHACNISNNRSLLSSVCVLRAEHVRRGHWKLRSDSPGCRWPKRDAAVSENYFKYTLCCSCGEDEANLQPRHKPFTHDCLCWRVTAQFAVSGLTGQESVSFFKHITFKAVTAAR